MTLTDFSQMNLSNIDLVYAISQQQLNGAVATALAESSPHIDFAYANNKGTWTPATEALPATIKFSGIWAPVVDANSGNLRVSIIDMSQGATLQAGQVILNLTFAAGATLTDTFVNQTYTQPDPTQDSTPLSQIWTMQMTVSLSVAALETSQIPATVQKQLNILNQKYGEIFSVQQVVADLSTLAVHATLNSTPPTGVDATSWQFFQTCLGAYFVAQENIGNVPLACLITQNASQPKVSPPAITPTSAGFVIVPNSTSPDLSALVFAMMSQNSSLPAATGANNLSDCFSDYGFTDPNATGTIVIRESPVATVINKALSSSQVPAAMSFYLAVSAPTQEWPVFTQTADTNVSAFQTIIPSSTNNNQIASFSYTNTKSNGSDGLSYWSGNATVTNAMSVNLQTSSTYETPSLVNISGSIVISAVAEYGSGKFPHDSQLNPTTFSWNAGFQLQNDDSNQGQIDFNMTTSNFNATPTTQTQSGWDNFLAAITGTSMNVDFNGIFETISGYVSSSIKDDFTTGFADLQSFVLPGNNVFSFSSVFINSNCNLVVNMQYRDLGASRPATTA